MKRRKQLCRIFFPDPDKKAIARRMKALREYSGFSRKNFGKVFHTKHSTVYEWENGRCIPRMGKLLSIALYFNISLDCLIKGEAKAGNRLEEMLCSLGENDRPLPTDALSSTLLISRFHSLPSNQKERLLGYLEALVRDNSM